ncbi:MAG: prolyl oligopeptidase family serine peptidase [Bacteroidota bacterium]
MRTSFSAFLLAFSLLSLTPRLLTAQSDSTVPVLSVEKVMQDPKWMGASPTSFRWSEAGDWLYFRWNPQAAESDSLYKVPARGGEPLRVSKAEEENLPPSFGTYDRAYTRKLYTRKGDIYLLDLATQQETRLTQTEQREQQVQFSADEQSIFYVAGQQVFQRNLQSGFVKQLTNFRSGKKPGRDAKPKDAQKSWVEQEEKRLIQIIRERSEKAEEARQRRENEPSEGITPFYYGTRRLSNISVSPDGKYISFMLTKSPPKGQGTEVPNYIEASGYTRNLNARPKVGSPGATYASGIYLVEQDTVLMIPTDSLPGIRKQPDYLEAESEASEARPVMILGPRWSRDGQHAVVVVRSLDFKDRWIMQLHPESAALSLLDHQRDEAWIGGPGINRWMGSLGTLGWLPDQETCYFQSEETGFSHLYTYHLPSQTKKALTSGPYEIFNPRLSRDGSQWFFSSSEGDLGQRHFYRMPLEGGKATRLTSMPGNNRVTLSPDEKKMAISHSTANRPWELFLSPVRKEAKARRITHSLSEEFLAYPWREPQYVEVPAADGATIPGRLYRPDNPEKQGPAVIFVHGAGYLQNAHKWWSSYFREYMFHNFLVDQGYTVLDLDFRASAGYGRDWRTAVYRDMGGKDLSDQVDGATFLTDSFDVAADRIGIYGGSYGGFITLMALFRNPGVFQAGAALRPVTDWAHYNHGYTGSMLNMPQDDSLAYVRSSPIYHAEGLQDALLICHGMVDTNVHFQDVVRLAQRLIELGKDNWEVALFPVEGHGFREPSSWTDEYKRIYKLFETHLK